MPAPVAQETRKTPTIRSSSSSNAGELGQQVDLVQHDRLRPLVEPGTVGASSRSIVRKRSSTSSSDASITCRSSRARSRCARNSCPSPIPSLAPSIRPGTSATVSWRAVRRLDRAEHGRERRERVVRDLRLRVRDAAQKRRLAGVREPGERRVGEQLQPQLELALSPGSARPRRSAAPAGSASRSARCRGRRCRPARATTRASGATRSATRSPSTP